jgi:CubicO group peptidase (beta-lactamase class C family)
MYIKTSSSIFICIILSILLSSCGGDSNSAKKEKQNFKELKKMEQAIDIQVDGMMKKTGASAATVAVMKNGILQYEQAYGYSDTAKKIPLKTDVLMRTASIIKPVTAAAVRKLATDGTLSLTDHVYCTGNNAPCWLSANFLSENTDARIKDVTLQHLIDHQGGFSRASDPQGGEYVVWEDCEHFHCPATQADLVHYMLAQPLDFTPGSKPNDLDGYSNYGYMVLGMIIEQASKMSYTRYVQTAIMAQIGIADSEFKAGRSLPKDHDTREPVYISTEDWPSAFTKDKIGPFAEEGAIAENWESVGYSISTAKTMATFGAFYKIPSGEALTKGTTNNGAHWGALDGSATFLRQLPSGVSYAVLLNIGIDLKDYGDYQTQLDAAAELAP